MCRAGTSPAGAAVGAVGMGTSHLRLGPVPPLAGKNDPGFAWAR